MLRLGTWGRRFNSSISLVNSNDNYISVKLNGKIIQYSSIFLRDACSAPESVDKHSSQKLFTTADISKDLKVHDTKVVHNKDGDVLQVKWFQNGQNHISEYSFKFLDHYSTRESRIKGRYFEDYRIVWNNSILTRDLESINTSYDAYMNDEQTFHKMVQQLNKYGLCFVNDLPQPTEETMTEENVNHWPVSKLANKFGYIKKTFYGTLFDVKNVKEAKNIAYTNSFLPLHMDLLYYESPPGLQFLHAIQNSTLGGENIFVDSFVAAKYIREKDPRAFNALTQIPITYQYNNNNEFYYYQRPLVVEDERIDAKSKYPFIKEVNYSPPFQGPFELGITKSSGNSMTENANHSQFNDFLRGLRMFEEFINNPENQYQLKMPEKSCVIFDNRRVLHSRLEFSDSNGGDRWLMGCYVDGDSYKSKLRIASRFI
ncbi:probable oxidoreductase Aim17p [[Candida] jaroonii]|uniref:Probable oxidoreductase Aim17p n=1 Tax=[Candida] jaroonii TaxID=467808 RepID=A0ACA9Y2R9_9ASCO|nr:probable oxidoreductase Aim17p [[Candida] jaroonii]